MAEALVVAYRMIAGLGNPGRRYEGTRHNLGFLVVDALLRYLHGSWRTQGGADIAAARLGGEKVWLLKPRNYMNCSGQALVQSMQFYKVAPEELVVVHDDLDLTFGKLRVKQGGGHGGHNGVRSVMESLGVADFSRVRMGIGRPIEPEGCIEMADWVLSRFSQEESQELEGFIERGLKAVLTLLSEGLQVAQNRHN